MCRGPVAFRRPPLPDHVLPLSAYGFLHVVLRYCSWWFDQWDCVMLMYYSGVPQDRCACVRLRMDKVSNRYVGVLGWKEITYYLPVALSSSRASGVVASRSAHRTKGLQFFASAPKHFVSFLTAISRSNAPVKRSSRQGMYDNGGLSRSKSKSERVRCRCRSPAQNSRRFVENDRRVEVLSHPRENVRHEGCALWYSSTLAAYDCFSGEARLNSWVRLPRKIQGRHGRLRARSRPLRGGRRSSLNDVFPLAITVAQSWMGGVSFSCFPYRCLMRLTTPGSIAFFVSFVVFYRSVSLLLARRWPRCLRLTRKSVPDGHRWSSPRLRRRLALPPGKNFVGDDVVPRAEHLDVPHVRRAVQGALLPQGGGAFVPADVFLVSLAAPRALGETTVRHGS